MLSLERAAVPTMYFIGVTTRQSSIMKIFPAWARHMELDGALSGIDLPLDARPVDYQDVVSFIKGDPLSLGALVTTHKMNLLQAAWDAFDDLDPYARTFREVSSISKRAGRLCGHAKDLITSGLAMRGFLPAGYWKEHQADVLLLGSGGSALAISAALSEPGHVRDYPRRMTLTNNDPLALAQAKDILTRIDPPMPVDFVLCSEPEHTDALMHRLPPHSMVVNATGMGKDRPGSPITADARFPDRGVVWELNYRGTLEFLRQARAQQWSRQLHIHDGWAYFIHGWTEVIAEVFDIALDQSMVRELEHMANGLVGKGQER